MIDYATGPQLSSHRIRTGESNDAIRIDSDAKKVTDRVAIQTATSRNVTDLLRKAIADSPVTMIAIALITGGIAGWLTSKK